MKRNKERLAVAQKSIRTERQRKRGEQPNQQTSYADHPSIHPSAQSFGSFRCYDENVETYKDARINRSNNAKWCGPVPRYADSSVQPSPVHPFNQLFINPRSSSSNAGPLKHMRGIGQVLFPEALNAQRWGFDQSVAGNAFVSSPCEETVAL